MRPIRPTTAIGPAVAAVAAAIAASVTPAAPAPKVFVLGIDGFDPELMQRFIDDGELPNFARLAAEGDYTPLQTTMPPQSPVAWSSFITGMDPGGHGIFDFVHRDPETILPYLSMARAEPPSRSVALGRFVLPLASGSVVNLRRGVAFWEILERNGVPTTVFRMPANFPPVEAGGRSLSGMGTPDIKGTSGTFSFYTDREVPNAKEITGGEIYYVTVENNRVRSTLHGPENSFRRVPRKQRATDGSLRYTHPDMTVDFTVDLDPELPVAMIEVGDRRLVLEQGEWSPWVPLEFEAVPWLISVSAIGRFYLKQVRPDFELYVTPLQIDPADPALPISTPASWSSELHRRLGYFYTQELPEDTKALSGGVFTGEEFWDQFQFVYQEQSRALDYLLSEFDEGFMFFYFSSVDQGSHMLWRYADPDHPAYEEHTTLLDGIRTTYRQLDDALGRVLRVIDDETTLIVMSDHGFCPFYRGVNLNSWLVENGYVTLRDPAAQGRSSGIPFANVDWSRTRAYALGLNGLYVNLAGREERGIVQPGDEYERLLDELDRRLLALTDPANGQPVVTLVTRPGREFHGPQASSGPDLLVGYNRGYRSSWTSPLGEFPRGVFVDNDEAWSGDHLVDYRHVPGVLLSNRQISCADPALYDLTVAILDEYGIDKTPEMIGRDCLGSTGRERRR
ncbi:MAG TPA: alkaline phosphatase family protein [Candidatus Polarisedimenticolaceae bacterium]|nr:alkaline phosphatase family protein [Candidatus Polarisedimenticolaceae bacterium]